MWSVNELEAIAAACEDQMQFIVPAIVKRVPGVKVAPLNAMLSALILKCGNEITRISEEAKKQPRLGCAQVPGRDRASRKDSVAQRGIGGG